MLVTQSRCGSGFFSTPRMDVLEALFVGGRFDLVLADVLDGAGEEAAGAAGGVEDDLAEARVGALDHELGDGARGVVFAGVAGALEVAQELLVDVAEQVAVFGAVEVDALVDLVDDLPQEGAGLHVVVGVLERGAEQGVARGGALQVLEAGEEVVVDEFWSSSPVMPSASAAQLRQRSFWGSGER